MVLWECAGFKSHRSAEGLTPMSEIDLVLVGDDASAILQSSDSGKPMVQRFRTTSVYLGWRQPKVGPIEPFLYNQCEQHDVPRAIKILRTQ